MYDYRLDDAGVSKTRRGDDEDDDSKTKTVVKIVIDFGMLQRLGAGSVIRNRILIFKTNQHTCPFST